MTGRRLAGLLVPAYKPLTTTNRFPERILRQGLVA